MKKLTLGLAIVLSVVMLLSFGAFANETENVVEILLPVGESEVKTASLDSDLADADIVVYYVESGNFYGSGAETEVIVRFNGNMRDAKDNLKLSIVDENGATIANQVSNSFEYQEYGMDSLVYKLQTVPSANISYEHEYQIKFTYSGSYTFDCMADYLNVYPMLNTAIVRIDPLDVNNSVFLVKAANVDKNETYYMTLNYGDPVEVDVADGTFVVDFDEYNGALSEDIGQYYDFAMYSMDEDGYQDNFSGYNDYYFGQGKGTYSDDNYNGIYIPEAIGYAASSFYVNAEKEDYTAYSSTDTGEAILYNASTGEVVGSGKLSYYYDDYDQGYTYLDGEVNITKTLEPGGKYILATDDGYGIRLNTVYATSAPICENVAIKNGEYYSNTMPTAEKAQGNIYEPNNMPDISKIYVEILDDEDNSVVYSMDEGSAKLNQYGIIEFTMTRKAPVNNDYGYTLYAYYNNSLVCEKYMYLDREDDSYYEEFLFVNDCIQTESATYFYMESSARGFNPQNVTFTLTSSDGTTKTPVYQRELYSNEYYRSYILKLNESLSFLHGEWTLTASDSKGELASEAFFSSSYRYEPFMYSVVIGMDGYTYLFGEGFSDSASYAVYLWDTNTETEVKVPVTKVSGEGAFKIANDAVSKYGLSPVYSIFFTVDNTPFMTVEPGHFQPGEVAKRTAFYSTYSGQNHIIAVLNLPSDSYTQYKLADSEAGLASASYKAITNSVIYMLPGDSGEQTIYAQFKDANGKESAVRKATVNVDASKPVLSELTDVPAQFLAKENSWGDLQITISFAVTAGEEGALYYYFADENGEMVSEVYNYSVREGQNSINRTTTLYDAETLTAKKLVVYMMDAAGNKSDELTAPTSIVEKHSKYTVGKTTYYLNNETGAIDNVDSEDKEIVVPSTLGGKPVTYIGTNAFAEEYTVKKITLPESITTIAMGAFSNMSLEEINIPSKVTILSDSLFMNTRSLKKLMLPAGLKKIENGAFSGLYSCPAIYFDGTKAQWDMISIASGGNSVIYGDYATIYFAESSADIEEVYDEGHENDGMLVVEVTLGTDTGMKTIIVNGNELYYSMQRNVYVGLVNEDKISDDILDGITIIDEEPSGFIYGNADGDYDVETYDEAVDGSDLQSLKLHLKGNKALSGMNLIASDVDGDGLCDGADLQSMKLYVKSGRQFSVLK